MSRILKSYLLNGSGGEITATGWSFDRVYLVGELTAAGDAKLAQAAVTTGVPQIGAPHDHILGTYAVKIRLREVSADKVEITVTYARESSRVPSATGLSIEYTSSRTQRETSKDKDGNLLTVTYEGTESGPLSVTVTATDRSIVVTYNTPDDPVTVIDSFDDSVNAAGWKGYAARTWHCSVSARKNSNDVTWEMRFDLAFEDMTFDAYLKYPSPTGDALPGLELNNGVEFKRCIREVNFASFPFRI